MSGVVELVNGSAAYIPITPRDNTNGSLKTSSLTLTAVYVQIANGTITAATSPTLTHKGNGVHVLYVASGDLGTNGNGTIAAVIADCFAVEIPIRVVTELTNTAATRLTSTRAGYIDDINSLNDLSAADVNAEVDSALADYDPPTKAEMDSAFAALNDLSAADVNAEVDTALADYDPPTKAEMDAAFIDIKGSTWSGSTDTLEQIRDNLISASAVNAEVDTALADYDSPTKAEMDSAFAALNDLSAAEVNAEVDTALSDYDGPTKTEMDSAFTEIKGATFSGATDSLEALRDRGDAAWIGDTAENIADAVWDEDLTEHTTANSAGKIVSDVLARIGAFTGSGVNTILGFFLAAFKKDASTPSDIGGTFSPAADSLEAIRDRGDAAWRNITAATPSASSGQTFFNQNPTVKEIVQNDDYAIDERPLVFEDDGSWGLTPTQINNLTAIKFTARLGSEVIAVTKTSSVSDWVDDDGDGGGTATIHVPLSSSDTAVDPGDYLYDLQLTLASGTVWTVERGTLRVSDDQTDPN